MRRFYTYLVVGLFASLLWSGVQTTAAHAAPVEVPPSIAPSVVTPLRTVAAGSLFDFKTIDCGGGDAASVGLSGVNIDVGVILTRYIICPMVNACYLGVQFVINLIESSGLLEVKPLLQNGTATGDSANVFATWSVFRDLANFSILMALLLVVFSQATSYGLSSYGVKKMLPKIVIAALLINLSYVICAVLVDIFNILGTSLDNVLDDALTAAMGGNQTAILDRVNPAIAAGVAFMANPATFGMLSLIFLIFLFILVLLGIASVFFLIARQVLIVLLIVGAPLAFMAWLFPNTESYFRKWWSTLIRLLAIYPVVMSLTILTKVIVVALSTLAG